MEAAYKQFPPLKGPHNIFFSFRARETAVTVLQGGRLSCNGVMLFESGGRDCLIRGLGTAGGGAGEGCERGIRRAGISADRSVTGQMGPPRGVCSGSKESLCLRRIDLCITQL